MNVVPALAVLSAMLLQGGALLPAEARSVAGAPPIAKVFPLPVLRPHRQPFTSPPAILVPAALPATRLAAAIWLPDGGDLASFITALEQTLEQMRQWLEAFQGSAADVLTHLVAEAPGQLPDGVDLPGMLAQLTGLPDQLRTILEAVRVKLLAPIAAGGLDERHHEYTNSNPVLGHQAVNIAAADQVVAGATVQQTAAAQATAAAAAAVSRDPRPEEDDLEAQQTGMTLVASAHGLPSTRAGMELLVAGLGAGMHQQADLQAAAADRLTLLVQQTAQVSQQLSALAATSATETLRLTDQDRAALDAQLGFADAVSKAAGTLQDFLSGVGDSAAADPQLSSLY
jgi:hypothetical protein